jgi:diguanylate cyclase (GGDEF)-like protein
MITDQDERSLILIADDDAFARMQLRLILEQEGYQIIESLNGRDTLMLYERLQPDMVLLDAIMPEMDGFECCMKLQTFSRSSYTPVLMITGLDDQVSVDQAFKVGAADYVTKPIHWAVLRQRVRRLLQQSKLQYQLEVANQKLQRLASIDGLTQIANRRCFDEHLEYEWQRAARSQSRVLNGSASLSLILCDVDFFKQYNDTYGHQAGDRCLQQIAEVIAKSIKRPADLAARYGGEEFAILLPETHSLGAGWVAAQIVAKVQSLAIPHASSPTGCVTLSAGVATVDSCLGSNVQQLVALADIALYQAKQAGRNQVSTQLEDKNTIAQLALKNISI